MQSKRELAGKARRYKEAEGFIDDLFASRAASSEFGLLERCCCLHSETNLRAFGWNIYILWFKLLAAQ